VAILLPTHGWFSNRGQAAVSGGGLLDGMIVGEGEPKGKEKDAASEAGRIVGEAAGKGKRKNRPALMRRAADDEERTTDIVGRAGGLSPAKTHGRV
jgi:hypothetical protein